MSYRIRFDADTGEATHLEAQSYFSSVKYLPGIIDNATEALAKVEYDTLVGTGISGAIVVPVLAYRLFKKYAIVRKANDGSHSSNMIEGSLGKRWIFVDDFIASGKTINRVKNEVANVIASHHLEFSTTFVGSFLYENNTYISAQEESRDIINSNVLTPTINIPDGYLDRLSGSTLKYKYGY